MEKLEASLKQLDILANEAEAKYEEVGPGSLCLYDRIYAIMIH